MTPQLDLLPLWMREDHWAGIQWTKLPNCVHLSLLKQ